MTLRHSPDRNDTEFLPRQLSPSDARPRAHPPGIDPHMLQPFQSARRRLARVVPDEVDGEEHAPEAIVSVAEEYHRKVRVEYPGGRVITHLLRAMRLRYGRVLLPSSGRAKRELALRHPSITPAARSPLPFAALPPHTYRS